MKKLLVVPLAALLFAACSDPTNPSAQSDLSPSYAKPVPPPPPTVTGNLVNDTYDFNADVGVVSSGGESSWGTDTPSGFGASSASTQVVPNDASNRFLGRFEETATRVLLVLTNGGERYSLAFDAYIIGSWDGKGKQAQSGFFEANVFEVGYRCSAGTGVTLFYQTTFSNQLTVQQDYPKTLGLGGYKAATGSIATDALGYKDHPELSNTPPFRSFGDVTYRLSFAGNNPCGADAAVTFVLSSSNPSLQSVHDESWGVDNVTIKADT